jgi:polyphosphate kinase 2 (PPK2 family)
MSGCRNGRATATIEYSGACGGQQANPESRFLDTSQFHRLLDRNLHNKAKVNLSLTKLLKHGVDKSPPPDADKILKDLQLQMLRIEQGLFFARKRAIIALEGFDASGKGGSIRRLTETLDPRGYKVYPIGPPLPEEQGRHWLYRFWTKLPVPGEISIFDRTWYGRVLVERVENLTPKKDWKRGYKEIREFEAMLTDDGIDVVKIFLAISKKEQLHRFRDRLTDPYKQWKLTDSDIRARKEWNLYVHAVDNLLTETDTKNCPWHLVAADNKDHARIEVLKIVTHRLHQHGVHMEEEAAKKLKKSSKKALRELGLD